MPSKIRNIAIVAHVDHGKTTLVDGLLRQTGTFRQNQVVPERVMDSNELERERGITILSKNTAIMWRGVQVNIVDTPGHSDFGGEVERVLGMVDATLLLVDAFEGPMPQTRFVLRKSLERGHKPIVVINKVDRPGCSPDRAVDQVFDLFVNLGATDDQLDFPVIYASARDGWASPTLDGPRSGLSPLLDLVIERVPPPPDDVRSPLQLQVATLDHSGFLGRIAIGRIFRGCIQHGMRAVLVRRDGSLQPFRVMKLMGFRGLELVELESASAGEIVAVAGVADVNIGETICPEEHPEPLPLIAVDEPTISMFFIANDGPFSGNEGKYVTSRQLRERLAKETIKNVAIRVEDTERPDTFLVSGRGELQLGILIEQMRREGYELLVSRPRPILRTGPNGETLEPIEEVVIEVPEAYQGVVLEKLGPRRALVERIDPLGNGQLRLQATVPARGLFGYRSQFLTDTRGEGILVRVFRGYEPWRGSIAGRVSGSLVALEPGMTTTYALLNLQDRGTFFVPPREPVYAGQVVGERPRPRDLIINVCKAKHLTNIRHATKEQTETLAAHHPLTLDTAIEFIDDDELVEVTPVAVRVRKPALDHAERARVEKGKVVERE